MEMQDAANNAMAAAQRKSAGKKAQGAKKAGGKKKTKWNEWEENRNEIIIDILILIIKNKRRVKSFCYWMADKAATRL